MRPYSSPPRRRSRQSSAPHPDTVAWAVDAGELCLDLRPRKRDGAGPTAYLFHDPPLSLILEGNFGRVRFEGGDPQPQVLLDIPANPTGPERTYVFESRASDGTPTP